MMIWSNLFESPQGGLLAGIGACTLIAPGLCLVLGRPRQGSLARVLFAYAASAALAAAGLLVVRRDLLHAYGRLAVELAAPFELAFVLWILVTTVRTTRGFARDRARDDFHARINAAVRDAAGLGRLSGIVAGEISALYYGLFSWRARPSAPAGATAFSYAESGGYGAALPAFVALLALETTIVHMLLSPHLPRLAWLVTVLGAYAIVWVIADHRAVRLRPILVSAEGVLVRSGLRGTVLLPLASIRRVCSGSEAASLRHRHDHKRMNLLGKPHFAVVLTEPVVIHGLLGVERRVTCVGFCTDDPAGFCAALEALGVGVSGEVEVSRGDMFDRLRDGLRGKLRSAAIADAIAREMALLSCALFFWRPTPRRELGAREFTIYRKGSYGLVVGTLIFVSFIEMGVMDVLIRNASATAANVFLVLGAYAVLWFFGDFRAMKVRPIVLDDDVLVVRVGLRREARIPFRDIERIEPVGAAGEPRRERDYVRCTAFGPADMVLRLRNPARFEQMLGRIRNASRVGLSVDDEAAFDRSLRSRMIPCD
jgi:hypothetical protein